MMKMQYRLYIILVILLSNSFYLLGQYKDEMSIGIVGKSYFFQAYNKYVCRENNVVIIENPRKPNGYSFGLDFDYNLTDFSGIGGSITYSKQYQKYLSSNSSHGDYWYYNVEIKRDFDYINIPVKYYMFKSIGYKSSYYVKLSLGINISYLANYIINGKQYYNYAEKIFKDSIQNKIIIENNVFHREMLELLGNYIKFYDGKMPNPFHKIVLGAIGDIAIEKYYLNKFKFTLGLDFYHAFTILDNIKKGKLWNGYGGWGSSIPRDSRTYNRSMGLKFSVKYILNPQSYYQ